MNLKIPIWALPRVGPTVFNCESKPSKDPLKHTQKISSKSVQPFSIDKLL